MSVVPFLFELDPWEPYGSLYNYRSPYNFGASPRSVSQVSIPRWANSLLSGSGSDAAASSLVGKDGFQACIDVQQFKPNELTVKTVDNIVIIEGKHEERQDEHGNIYRHFLRKYELAEGYDPKDVVSALSSDGILTVKAPPPPTKALKGNERTVQIQQTGPAHLNVSENPADATECKKDKK